MESFGMRKSVWIALTLSLVLVLAFLVSALTLRWHAGVTPPIFKVELDGAAHKLQAVLDGLHAKSDFRFLPNRTHMDLYVQGKDRQGLLKQISWEMYAVARPDSPLKAPATPAQ